MIQTNGEIKHMNKATKEQLNIIAERLWNGETSLFVGAGLSKNAKRLDGAQMPPNWDELGDIFFFLSML